MNPPAKMSSNTTSNNRSKTRVMLIDDESAFTQTVKLVLESTGRFEVAEVNEGGKAVAVARTFRPDIIFCDIVMPEHDGGDVAAMLREVPELSQVPIVFLTAIVAESEAKKGTIGGFPFLAKPVGIDQLTACIEKQLGRMV